jgi:hypothetical protein
MYQVKYPWPGKLPESEREHQQWQYGIVVNDSRQPKIEGMVLVADAILPMTRWQRVVDVIKLPLAFGSEYDQYVESELQRASAESDAAGEGLQVRSLFNVGVADGRAWYVVTRVTKRTATVEWRGFCLDRYTDSVLGWGGTFPRHTIERLVLSCQALARLFPGPKAA